MTATALQRPQRRPGGSAGKGFTPIPSESPIATAKEARAREPRGATLGKEEGTQSSPETQEGREREKERASRPRRFWGHTRIRRVHDAKPRDQVPAMGCDVPGGPHPSFPALPCPSPAGTAANSGPAPDSSPGAPSPKGGSFLGSPALGKRRRGAAAAAAALFVEELLEQGRGHDAAAAAAAPAVALGGPAAQRAAGGDGRGGGAIAAAAAARPLSLAGARAAAEELLGAGAAGDRSYDGAGPPPPLPRALTVISCGRSPQPHGGGRGGGSGGGVGGGGGAGGARRSQRRPLARRLPAPGSRNPGGRRGPDRAAPCSWHAGGGGGRSS